MNDKTKKPSRQKDMKRRLLVDFPDEDKMKQFLVELRAAGIVPGDATIFKADGIDEVKGVTWGRTYILRRKGDRGENTELKL